MEYTQINITTPQQGWQCPACLTVHAPWKSYCGCQQRPVPTMTPDCSCPPYGTCNNTACPRRIQVTC